MRVQGSAVASIGSVRPFERRGVDVVQIRIWFCVVELRTRSETTGAATSDGWEGLGATGAAATTSSLDVAPGTMASGGMDGKSWRSSDESPVE